MILIEKQTTKSRSPTNTKFEELCVHRHGGATKLAGGSLRHPGLKEANGQRTGARGRHCRLLVQSIKFKASRLRD
jgi:hypothetical protein